MGEPNGSSPRPDAAAGEHQTDATLPPGSTPSSGSDATFISSAARADATFISGSGAPSPALPVTVTRGIEVYLDRFELRGELARGGMGRVLKAFDRQLQRDVVIKELLADSPDDRARFEREARLTARLQHPSIVSIYEAGARPSGEPFYVMRQIPGRTLDEAIAAAKTPAQRLALLPAIIAAVDALAYAHRQGIIHRDLKPGNVLVGEFGETVVIDWGLAKILGEADSGGAAAAVDVAGNLTLAGSVMGTPAFMSPEQARGAPLDARTDVYALGAILRTAIAGEPPFDGPSALQILERVRAGPPPPLDPDRLAMPPDLVAIAQKAMAHDPAERYAGAAELAEELRRFQSGLQVRAHHYTPGQLLARWAGRNRRPLAVAAVLLALMIAGGVAALVRIVDAKNRATETRLNMLTQQGRRELLADHAQRALAFFAPVLQARADDVALQFGAATALREAGAVREAIPAVARTRIAFAIDADAYAAGPEGQPVVVHALGGGSAVTLESSSDANHLAMSRSGGILVADVAGAVLVWDTRTGAIRSRIPRAQPPFALVPDDRGDLVLIGDATGVELYEVSGARRVFRRELAGTAGASFVGDELVVAWNGAHQLNGTVCRWRRDGSVRWCSQQEQPVGALAVTTDGEQVAAAGAELGGVTLLDGNSGAEDFDIAVGRVASLAFAPDGRSLAGIGVDGRAHVWESESGLERQAFGTPDSSQLAAVWSADGMLTIAANDGVARILEPSSGAPIALFDHGPVSLSDVALMSHGSTLVTLGYDRVLRLWDVAQARALVPLSSPQKVHKGLGDIAFDERRHLVGAISDGLAFHVWDGASGARLKRIVPPGGRSFPAALRMHQGTMLAVAARERGDLELLDLMAGPDEGTGELLRRVSVGDAAEGVAVDAEARFALALVGGRAKLVDFEAGTSRELPGDDALTEVDLAPRGNAILSCARGRCRLRPSPDAQAVELPEAALVNGASVHAFSADGRRLAYVNRSGGVVLVDTAQPGARRELTSDAVPSYALTFDREGRRLAASAEDGTLRIFDLAGSQPPLRVDTHADVTTGVLFGLPWPLLVVADTNGHARVWDAEHGEVIVTLESSQLPIVGAALSPDATELLLALRGGDAQLWKLMDRSRAGEVMTYAHQRDAYTEHEGRLEVRGTAPGR